MNKAQSQQKERSNKNHIRNKQNKDYRDNRKDW